MNRDISVDPVDIAQPIEVAAGEDYDKKAMEDLESLLVEEPRQQWVGLKSCQTAICSTYKELTSYKLELRARIEKLVDDKLRGPF